MSIKQPKPLQIRLPFSVARPNKSTSTQSKSCGICRKKDSRYTCPRCNILYCSLECFRNEAHAQCSEPFYKSSLLSAISTDPAAGMDEKKGMMEMLRRFEDAQAEGEDALEELRRLEKDEEDDEELVERLRDVDLDSIDSNALFHLLPPKHRDAFIQALREPESDITKSLLADAAEDVGDGEGEGAEQGGVGRSRSDYVPGVLPWWEDRFLEDEGEEIQAFDEDEEDGEQEKEGEGRDVILSQSRVQAKRKLESAPFPPPIPDEVLQAISPPGGVGRKLVYNTISICIAYLHTLLSFRLPSLDPSCLSEASTSSDEIRELIGELVSFLVQPRSTVRHETLSSAWGSVWEIINLPTISSSTPASTSAGAHSTQVLEQLLGLLPPLLHPPILTNTKPKITYVLNDLYHLFAQSGAATTTTTTTKPLQAKSKIGENISRKLAFYARALEQLERRDWLALEREVGDQLGTLREESGSAEEPDLTNAASSLERGPRTRETSNLVQDRGKLKAGSAFQMDLSDSAATTERRKPKVELL